MKTRTLVERIVEFMIKNIKSIRTETHTQEEFKKKLLEKARSTDSETVFAKFQKWISFEHSSDIDSMKKAYYDILKETNLELSEKDAYSRFDMTIHKILLDFLEYFFYNPEAEFNSPEYISIVLLGIHETNKQNSKNVNTVIKYTNRKANKNCKECSDCRINMKIFDYSKYNINMIKDAKNITFEK